MTHRRKGRKKGEKIGEGPIQILIRKRGGRRYVTRLYQEYRSADAVAQYIYNGFHLYCSGNTIRNIMRRYHIPINPAGGDRRSSAHLTFMKNRGSSHGSQP
ncbi:hypothetical protein ACFL6I_21380 [candidate division KSB1 bacterium]